MIDGSLHVVNKGARDQEKHLLGFFTYAPNQKNMLQDFLTYICIEITTNLLVFFTYARNIGAVYNSIYN